MTVTQPGLRVTPSNAPGETTGAGKVNLSQLAAKPESAMPEQATAGLLKITRGMVDQWRLIGGGQAEANLHLDAHSIVDRRDVFAVTDLLYMLTDPHGVVSSQDSIKAGKYLKQFFAAQDTQRAAYGTPSKPAADSALNDIRAEMNSFVKNHIVEITQIPGRV